MTRTLFCVKCRHRRPRSNWHRAGGALTDSYQRIRIPCSTIRSSDPLPAAMDARTAHNAFSGGQGVRGSLTRRSGGVSLPVASSHGLHRHGAGGGLVVAKSSLVCNTRRAPSSPTLLPQGETGERCCATWQYRRASRKLRHLIHLPRKVAWAQSGIMASVSIFVTHCTVQLICNML